MKTVRGILEEFETTSFKLGRKGVGCWGTDEVLIQALKEIDAVYKRKECEWYNKGLEAGKNIAERELKSKVPSVEEIEKMLTYYGIFGRPKIAQAIFKLIADSHKEG